MTGASSPFEFTPAPLRLPEANDDYAWLRNVSRDANRFGPFTHSYGSSLDAFSGCQKCLHGRMGKRRSFEE